jgi:hypothetical protein
MYTESIHTIFVDDSMNLSSPAKQSKVEENPAVPSHTERPQGNPHHLFVVTKIGMCK